MQVDVAPPGVLAATIEEVRAVLGAAAAGAGVAAGVPAGARGAVSTPLVMSEEQVRCCSGLALPMLHAMLVDAVAIRSGLQLDQGLGLGFSIPIPASGWVSPCRVLLCVRRAVR